MAAGDVAKVRTVCYTASQISVNVSFWRVVATGGALIPNSYVGFNLLFNLAMAPVYKPWMSSQARYRGTGCQLMQPASLFPATSEVTSVVSDGAGTGTAVMEATQVSGLIAWKTGLPGRHFQGRIFPGFADEVFQDTNGDLLAGGVAVLDGIRLAYTTPIVLTSGVDTETWALCVRSVVPGPGLPLVTYNTVTTGIARNKWATQRRRGQFGRTNALPF